jgi:hypothetical protein
MVGMEAEAEGGESEKGSRWRNGGDDEGNAVNAMSAAWVVDVRVRI